MIASKNEKRAQLLRMCHAQRRNGLISLRRDFRGLTLLHLMKLMLSAPAGHMKSAHVHAHST